MMIHRLRVCIYVCIYIYTHIFKCGNIYTSQQERLWLDSIFFQIATIHGPSFMTNPLEQSILLSVLVVLVTIFSLQHEAIADSDIPSIVDVPTFVASLNPTVSALHVDSFFAYPQANRSSQRHLGPWDLSCTYSNG